MFALAKRNDVVLPTEAWASEEVCLVSRSARNT